MRKPEIANVGTRPILEVAVWLSLCLYGRHVALWLPLGSYGALWPYKAHIGLVLNFKPWGRRLLAAEIRMPPHTSAVKH